MESIFLTEINCFALVILVIIFLNIYHRYEKYLLEQKLFMYLALTNAVIIVFDTGMWNFNGTSRFWLLVSTAAYYCFNPLICMIWALYTHYQIYRNDKKLKKVLLPLLFPVTVNAILSIISVTNGILFYVDQNNFYHRGKLFIIMFSASYIYLLYSFILIVSKHKRTEKKVYYSFLGFSIPPFLGGITQTLIPGSSIIWVATTISIFIIFVNIQNSQLYTDHLTGLYNRRQLDIYLRQKIQNIKNSSHLAGIMIDINNFKKINDIYGHIAGDEALVKASEIFRNTFGKGTFISRYGGDEFVVILETAGEKEISSLLQALEKNAELFNKKKNAKYELVFAIGYAFFDFNSMVNGDGFLKHIDDLMYKDKINRKNKSVL